jgi:hypothetical protein
MEMKRFRPEILGAVLLFAVASTAAAMPMFSRKYSVACAYCHTVIPRLNEAGYQFRAAGFRTPEEIGKRDEKETFKFEIADYDSVRLQLRYDLSRTDNAGVVTTTNQLAFHEITIYPLTGAFLGNYSSLFEISLAAGEDPEVENAYGRGNWKAGPGHFSARLGVFHPFEGYGASDRPIAIARPLFQTTSARFNQPTFFTPWGFDEAGLELGYTVNRTAFRATLFNGLTFSEEENTATPATSLSGSDSKVRGRPSYNDKDFQLFFNQIVTDNGGGVSLYYYNGRLDLPVVGAADNFFKNKFERYAAYASYPLGPTLLLGGYQSGRDDTFTASDRYGPRNTTRGWFGEVDVIPPEMMLGIAARYEQFDPSTRIDNNKSTRYLVAVNKPFNNGLQAIAEYFHRKTEQVTRADRKDDAFQVRFIWIW